MTRKIVTIGKDNEYEDTKSKGQADKLGKRFRVSLIVALISIVGMAICILISTYFIGEEEMAKDTTTKEAVVDTTEEKQTTTKETVVDTIEKKDPILEKSYGGGLPGFFESDQPGSTDTPNETPSEGEEVTTPQDTTPQDTTPQDTAPQDTDFRKSRSRY